MKFSETLETANSGNWSELASAIYADDKTKNTAKFYMGRFCEENAGDDNKLSGGYMLAKYVNEASEKEKIQNKKTSGYAHKFINYTSRFYTGDDHVGNTHGYKIIDFGMLYETDMKNFSLEEQRLFRQICQALDKNSQKEMNGIYEKYQNTPELQKVLNHIKDILPGIIYSLRESQKENLQRIFDPSSITGKETEERTKNLEDIAQKINLLNIFPKEDWLPEVQRFLMFDNRSYQYMCEKFYGINSNDFTQLCKIFEKEKAYTSENLPEVTLNRLEKVINSVPGLPQEFRDKYLNIVRQLLGVESTTKTREELCIEILALHGQLSQSLQILLAQTFEEQMR